MVIAPKKIHPEAVVIISETWKINPSIITTWTLIKVNPKRAITLRAQAIHRIAFKNLIIKQATASITLPSKPIINKAHKTSQIQGNIETFLENGSIAKVLERGHQEKH